jgi:hypothetical protein
MEPYRQKRENSILFIKRQIICQVKTDFENNDLGKNQNPALNLHLS